MRKARDWRRAGLMMLAGCCLGVGGAMAQEVTLRGFVTDAADGEPLAGANVVVRAAEVLLTGTITDRNGYYQLGGLALGEYVVQVSFIGYTPTADTLMLGARFVNLSVALSPADALIGEIVVEAEGGAVRVQAGLQTVRPADVQRIPTPDASGDLAAYLQSLPGILSLGDRGGQLYIRGGTPAQNLVLLDGMLVYQPFHIIGFFSAFPEDLIAYADVYAGGFGARYSGRLSSVIDVATREGNKQAFEGSASLSPFLAGVRVEGPLRKGSVSFLASVRRSVIEHTAPTVVGAELPFHFGDLFVKLHYTDGESSRCSTSFLHTYDRGRIDTGADGRDEVFRWSNVAFGGRCVTFPSASPFLFDVNVGVSYVQNEVGSAVRPERSSDALQVNTELNLRRYIGASALGMGLFVRMNWLGFSLSEQFLNSAANEEAIFSTGGYGEVKLQVGTGFTLTPGVAMTFYPFAYRTSIEPRLRMVWTPGGADGATELSAALGWYEQTLAGLTDERDAGSAFIAWTPPPLDNAQAGALHALVGVQQQLGARLRVGVEGYYKRLSHLTVPIWSTIARFTTTLTQAKGTAYGLDARAEVRQRPFYLYLGYGYAQTTYTAQQDDFGVWFGEPLQAYTPPHDRRHQFNAVASVERGRFTASIRWQYGSGLPYTRPFGFDELIDLGALPDVRRTLGTTRVLYNRPYEGRLPAYHRLDLSLERGFATRAGLLTVQLGAINVYDRANLFYFDLFTVRRVDQLPFIPNLSLKLETP